MKTADQHADDLYARTAGMVDSILSENDTTLPGLAFALWVRLIPHLFNRRVGVTELRSVLDDMEAHRPKDKDAK